VRFLHLADLHLGLPRYGSATPTGNSRIADFVATLNRAVDAAIAAKVHVLVIAGDTFNSRRSGPDELHGVVAACRRASEAGITVIIIPGNHDGMTVIADPRTHALNWLAAAGIPWVYVLTSPGLHRITLPGGAALSVFALPYPHKRAFDALLPDLTPEERVVEIGKRVTDAIETLAIRTQDGPFIFVGHVTVLGAKLGTEAAMRIGWDASITPEVLGRFDAAFLGHIHRMQKVAPNAWYPGAPEYIDFAEAGQDKGFLLWDVAPGVVPEVGIIPSGCRRLVNIPTTVVGGVPQTEWPANIDGAIVRHRIMALNRPDPRLVNNLITEARRRGASYVKTEVKVDAPAIVREREAVAEGDTVEAVRRWLVAHEHPEEPATSIAREMIASLAGQE
jgi:exonuclease SbcD